MRHGMPPILKTQALGIQPSLSVDVECTLTADMFTQMRSTMSLQRALVNQMILEPQLGVIDWPPPPAGTPSLLTTQDVLRYATINGARDLRLDHKIGTLTPGKEADIILLDAQAINVAPLNNVPGAVVSLMERSNVETVIVAGRCASGRASWWTSISANCAGSRGVARLRLRSGRHRSRPVSRVLSSNRKSRPPSGGP